MFDLDNNLVQIALIGGCALVAIVAIIGGSASSMARTRQREQTKREIAAYVAEGSITPQDAALLLAGGTDDVQKQIASGVADGSIDAHDAERLLAAVAKSGL